MSKVLIIDGNNNAHKAYHSYRNLSHKGKSVSVTFGFISMLRAAVRLHNPDQVIVCWDHSKHVERLKLIPNYKGHRKERQLNARFDYEDFQRQLKILRKALYLLGVTQIRGLGMEADDYIHWVSRIFRKKKYKVYILSSDKDFHQELQNKSTYIYDSSKRKTYTKKNLKDIFGYTPAETVDYLSLIGDSSDDIPGYRGIGPKKARKFLDEFGSIASFIDNPSNSFPGIDREKLLEIYEINRMMIDLPLFFKAHIKGKHKIDFYKSKRNPRFRPKAFKEICIHYGFHKFLEPQFVNTFKTLYNARSRKNKRS